MPADDIAIGFADARQNALERLYAALDADPEIEGVIGYSEGACTAASLGWDEQERRDNEGYVPRIKAAIFLMGWPALKSNNMPALADEIDDTLDAHSLHIVGANGKQNKSVTTPIITDHNRSLQGWCASALQHFRRQLQSIFNSLWLT